MFVDLLSSEIQPKEFDVAYISEIELSAGLIEDITRMLAKEEGKYVNVRKHTVIVQSDKNYVFFPNQWLYLAVLCKKYAEALYSYFQFFDSKIRTNINHIRCIAIEDYDNPDFSALFEGDKDKERMIRFIKGNSDYRSGEKLINGDNCEDTKEIFCTCILKKIPVPDTSSAYLGTLIYYLAKEKFLFDKLETEVGRQYEKSDGKIRLQKKVKDSAKQIVDVIYNIDKFERINELFIDGINIKINTEDVFASKNALSYIFAKPSSSMYNLKDTAKARVFTDKEYHIKIENEIATCRLSTQWKNAELGERGDGNYLGALIAVVNRYYSDVLEIKEEADGTYIYLKSKDFKYNILPAAFQNDFARRYIISLLAKPFVILTGNSGTGKTRISKQFAEYLEQKDIKGNKNWLIVPVGADWTDNTKVLGFFNPLADEGKGGYVKTDILKLMERANENKEIPYFIILDEMNLSHIERYFSDFLSHMETPDNPLDIDGYGTLEFPKNLFVVGTVNIDETTYMFSPKVLDRANVVEFKPDKQSVMDLFVSAERFEKTQAANDGSSQGFLKLAKDIQNQKSTLTEDDISTIRTIFTTVYEELQKCGFEFAYRTVKEIKQYISAAARLQEEFGEEQLTQAIDEQLLQKVLPKIHGNKKEIGELLTALESVCESNALTNSMVKIKQMKGRLEATQYASFI